MRNLKKQRRIQVIVLSALFLVTATALVGYGFRDGINLYRTPTQVLSDRPQPSETFRMGGLVLEGSLVRGQGETITFRVVDESEASIPVQFTGVPPDLFGEGEGTVVTGRMEGDIFVATEILAKHDENYMPKEVIDAMKEQGTYVDPNAPPASN